MTLTLDDANWIIEGAIANGRTPFNRGRRSKSCSIYRASTVKRGATLPSMSRTKETDMTTITAHEQRDIDRAFI
jgi:hypothetical protein